MGTKKTRGLPARLEGLRRRFERWRGTHKPHSHIPETLWGSAVKMAGMHGLHRTTKALRLDYSALSVHDCRLAHSFGMASFAGLSRVDAACDCGQMVVGCWSTC
jgi:hypothetical protein